VLNRFLTQRHRAAKKKKIQEVMLTRRDHREGARRLGVAAAGKVGIIAAT